MRDDDPLMGDDQTDPGLASGEQPQGGAIGILSESTGENPPSAEETAEVLPEEAPLAQELLAFSAPAEDGLREGPWWRRIFVWRRSARTASKLAPQDALTFTSVDEGSWLQEELAAVRAEVPQLVQAELARQQEDRHRATLRALQATADELSSVRLESLRTELALLDEAELPTLQNPDLPLRERLELVDWFRARRARAEQELVALGRASAERVAEAELALEEIRGRRVVAELQEAVERQGDRMSALEAKRGQGAWWRWGLAPTLVALLLVVSVGVLGVLQYNLWKAERTSVSQVYSSLGEFYLASDRPDLAEPFFKELLRIDPGSRTARLRLGGIYWERRQYLSAAQMFEDYLSSDPDNHGTLSTLGWAYLLGGQPYRAIDPLLRANDIQSNASLTSALGRAYAEMGQCDKAVPYLRKALEMDPNRPDARSALETCGEK